jgi:hypothetical protein
MSGPFLSFDAVRECESELWRALGTTLQLTRKHWVGSEVMRKAMERVAEVIEKQVQRTSAAGGDSQ